MKNTRKNRNKKNIKNTKKTKSTKLFKKHNPKVKYFLTGGDLKDPKCPYKPTESEKDYCNSFDAGSDERNRCDAELKASYEVTPGKCNYHTCCGDCNELCYPVRDIWRNGLYVPIKYVYDVGRRTLTYFIGGMYAFTITGMIDGAVKGAIESVKKNLPDIKNLENQFQGKLTKINPAAFTGIKGFPNMSKKMLSMPNIFSRSPASIPNIPPPLTGGSRKRRK